MCASPASTAPYRVTCLVQAPGLDYQQLPSALDSFEAEANELLATCGYPTARANVSAQKVRGKVVYYVWAPDPDEMGGTLASGSGSTPGAALAQFAVFTTPAAIFYSGAQL